MVQHLGSKSAMRRLRICGSQEFAGASKPWILAERSKRAPFAEKLRAGATCCQRSCQFMNCAGVTDLDFLSELYERQPVDAREQSAFAPFVRPSFDP